MTTGSVTCRRFFAAVTAAALALSAVPATTATAALDPELTATLELRDGFIDYRLEPGTLHFFDEENQPLAIQVIDGCAVNDHLWIFGAGLSGIPIPVTVTDLKTNRSARIQLPAFEPGLPIGTQFEPEALPICDDERQAGGLPQLDALATFSSANARGQVDNHQVRWFEIG